MMHRMLSLVIALAMLVSAGCHAQPTDTAKATVPLDWKTECVGRYQVSVPGEVEVALAINSAMTDRRIVNPFRFKDGSVAHYSASYRVSEMKNMDAFKAFEKEFDAERFATKANLIKESRSERSDFIKKTPLMIENAFGWHGEDFVDLYFYGDGHFFYFYKKNDEGKSIENFIKTMQVDFRPRALYELPKQPGICFPYGFIADDGKANRSIAVTMRMKNHPDVEVFFHDKSGDLSSGSNEPKDNIEYFWTKMYRDFAKLLEADSRKYYKVKMGEQDGTAMFVTITRHDGSKDYGYIAIVKGDPTAATDTPSQMLYVIRTAKRTKGKPVSKDELKDIAERITASVKRHAVQ